MDAEALAARVRAAFPELAFSTAELNQKGEDHWMLALDGRWAFRFPRHANHPTGLALELAVLAALKGRCDLSMPDYRFVAPDRAFAGYALIAGDELTPARFAGLSRAVQARVLDQVADFLSAMHSLRTDEVEARLGVSADWPRGGGPADQAADIRQRRLGHIARAFPDLLPSIEAFLARFERRDGVAERWIHSDVTSDHLLLSPTGEQLTGVIDFGDVELGDPAYDFGYLRSYGDEAPAHVFARYAFKDADPGLLERSHWQHARYLTARLGEAVERGWTDRAAVLAARLPGLIAEL